MPRTKKVSVDTVDTIVKDIDPETTEGKEKNDKEEKTEGRSKKEAPKKETLMGKIIADSATPPSIGDLVEGPIIAVAKGAVYVDLAPYGTGIIYGREYIAARDVIKKINIGDSVGAKVVDTDNPDGYIELSLKEAKQALIWSEAQDAIKEKRLLELPVIEANKGGLIINWQGIPGFLPASQLKTDHYPRISDGNKDRILDELKKLVGERLQVMIITAIPKEKKLIFSEKTSPDKEKEDLISKYRVGDEAEGTITGVVDFGIFVKLEEGLEGLVHISEIDWALVEDPKSLFKVNQTVRVKIIDIKDNKISLSIKALKTNPWLAAAKKYKKGDSVSAVIIKYNKHGALASIEEGVAGLVHVSDFGSEEILRRSLELGKSYVFKINLFDPKDQKMALSTKDAPVTEKETTTSTS